MARPSVVSWPTPDNAAVCALQTTTAAGSLIINGTSSIFRPSGSLPSYASFPQIIRQVTLTSTGNLSGINFTITGLGPNGTVISTTVAGPNNDTVTTSSTYFTTVTSVTANAAVTTAVSVGTGTIGYLNWLKYNYHATVCAMSVAVDVTGTINYTFGATLDDVTQVASPYIFDPILSMVSATSSVAAPVALLSLPYSGAGAPTYTEPVYAAMPLNYYTIFINSSNSSGGLVATFIQQGIT